MTRDFNAYIALTLDETLTIELRTKALLSYLNEISALLAAANAILEDLHDIIIYETDLIFQGWINDGTLSAILNAIIQPIINQINNQVSQNQSFIVQLQNQQNSNNSQINSLVATIASQTSTLSTLLTRFTSIQTIADNATDKYKTLTDTLNTALNTITTIQNRLTSSENSLGTLQDQVSGYQTQYNALQNSDFRQAITDLQTRVTSAQTQLESVLEQHTSNLTNIINLYAQLTTALDNLVSFADIARQFQASILQVINFIDQNQTTVNNNQQTITLLMNQINNLLTYQFDYTNQLNTINLIRNYPTLILDTIQDSMGGTVYKSRYNGTVTYDAMVTISTGNATSQVFTDPELAQFSRNNQRTNTTTAPTYVQILMVGTAANPQPTRGIITSNGTVQGDIGSSTVLLFCRFSIYIPMEVSL